jgi:delta 1-pyrroline-5-carboxylate dehydrogenase
VFQPERGNSKGFDLRNGDDLAAIETARGPFRQERFRAVPAIDGPDRERFTCISPWNFPLAIFTGQIAGALAMGNAVLAKPAEQTPLIAAMPPSNCCTRPASPAPRCNSCPATARPWARR